MRLINRFTAIHTAGRVIVAGLVKFGIDMTVAAARCKGTIGIATAINAGVLCFAEVAFFVIALKLAVTAIGREPHTTSHTFIFAIRAVVYTIVADFAGVGRNDAITACWEFTFGCAACAAVVVISGAEIAFFTYVRIDDAITAIPLACVAIAKGIVFGVAFFTGIEMFVATI